MRPRFFSMLFSSALVVFRALLCELHRVGPSHLFLLQRDGHGVSSSGEGFIYVSTSLVLFIFSLSLCTKLSPLAPLAGDGVPGGPRVQGRPGRLPACAGEAVDDIPQSAAQLLRAG